MPPPRVLAADGNGRGDLFATLVGDLFFALGYDAARLNVHKAGREIDLEAPHRTEQRTAMAECKATAAPIGGSDLNKFVGALDAERRERPAEEIVGYFVSLAGFTQTAIEQEKKAGGRRAVLVTGGDVVEQLVKSKLVCSPELAQERAGRCAADCSADLLPLPAELLCHEAGWIWLLKYEQDHRVTHFALVHADGRALDRAVADQVVETDAAAGGDLAGLAYLPPRADPAEEPPSDESQELARSRYCAYVVTEYGSITLEGLPTDEHVGSRPMRLEELFVPLDLLPAPSDEDETESAERTPFGHALRRSRHLALLAAPGGGKSTLLKRLAVAYADPARRADVDDELPDRPFLPLIIRCRQLGPLAREPIRTILQDIPRRAEMPDLAGAFDVMVTEALQRGEVLLLVDGLDEISDEGERVRFVGQLRTFMAMYPTAQAVVTSRQAGFRVVAGVLASVCDQYTVAPLDDDGIEALATHWLSAATTSSADAGTKARELAATISAHDRVRRLAENPLLLTTLLLVQRWVGTLPARRSVLYGQAIDVLLRTWNVEGYDPIDPDEAIPQLAYIAYAMMLDGVQRVNATRVKELIRAAREQMPEILGYTKLDGASFVKRIEERSSLLSHVGHELDGGEIVGVYEFKHLTFQEYLAALAIVKGYHPSPAGVEEPMQMLQPHLEDEKWQEVIPLTAVLAGRQGGRIVSGLIAQLQRAAADGLQPEPTGIRSRGTWFPVGSRPGGALNELLAQCLLDEVQLAPAIVEAAALALGDVPVTHDELQRVGGGKYGEPLRDASLAGYMQTMMGRLGSNAAWLDCVQRLGAEPGSISIADVDAVEALAHASEPADRALAALDTMSIAHMVMVKRSTDAAAVRMKRRVRELSRPMLTLLASDVPPVHVAAAWALAKLGNLGGWEDEPAPGAFARLVEIWRSGPGGEPEHKATWAITELPLPARAQDPGRGLTKDAADFVASQWDTTASDTVRLACLVVSYCFGVPWDEREVVERLEPLAADSRISRATPLAERLGLTDVPDRST